MSVNDCLHATGGYGSTPSTCRRPINPPTAGLMGEISVIVVEDNAPPGVVEFFGPRLSRELGV